MKILDNRRYLKNKHLYSKKTEPAAKSTFKDTLSLLALFLSVLATVLSFTGYGVALATNIVFSIPHEPIFQSTFELLELSVWAVTSLYSKAGEISFKSTYITLLSESIFGGLILLASWFITYGIIKLPSVRSASAKKLDSLKRKILVPPSEKVPFRIVVLQGLLGFATYVVAMPLIVTFLLYLFLTLTFIMPIISLIGEAAAERHLKEYVIEPTRCQPLQGRIERIDTFNEKAKKKSNEKVALCLSIKLPREIEFQGREAVTTSSSIVLFDPDTGKVQRIPLRNAIIETVGELRPTREETSPTNHLR
ncbi:hypothetical protein MKD49_08400 [Herbaspirillum sp. WGmk3]|uniref:hypothetical protein n=1 Tax=Herbaspirillum sp. WGmk3 TaxID=2919925 RepID=UPI002090753A|nr:hypothetical protein [Herbaspirillum sp. WGmk3]MCO4856499.1 hypothetical protein [Herbaspirillum sp. WGmk3]